MQTSVVGGRRRRRSLQRECCVASVVRWVIAASLLLGFMCRFYTRHNGIFRARIKLCTARLYFIPNVTCEYLLLKDHAVRVWCIPWVKQIFARIGIVKSMYYSMWNIYYAKRNMVICNIGPLYHNKQKKYSNKISIMLQYKNNQRV